jgi:hypothetical protein
MAFPYPTDGKPLLAARYYLEDMKLVIGAWSLELAALGLIAWIVRERVRRTAALLLLVPLPFYVQSMAYGAVPLYVPTLFPNTYYNLRYGLEMLPALAVLTYLIPIGLLPSLVRLRLTVLLAGVLAVQALWTISRGLSELPLVKEGILNTPCRGERQRAIVAFMHRWYDGGILMLPSGKWPCLVPAIGVPLRQTVTEANRAYWRRLSFEPQKWVEWIVRSQGDAVDDLMRAYPQAFNDFELLWQETFPHEGTVSIYRRRAGRGGLRLPRSVKQSKVEGRKPKEALGGSLYNLWTLNSRPSTAFQAE